MASSNDEISHDLMRTLIQLLRQTLETTAGGGLAAQVQEMMAEFSGISQALQGILEQLDTIATDLHQRSEETRKTDPEVEKLTEQVQVLSSEVRELTSQLNLPFGDGSTS